jgi:ketosteroid isomerase-like protein
VVLIVNDDLGPFSTSLTGKPAVGEWFGDWFRQFAKDYRFDIEEALDAGDDVVVVARHHGSGRRSGAAVERRAAYVFSVREGRIAQIELWLHEHARDAALEAAGLSA